MSASHARCRISNDTFASSLQFTSCMGGGAWTKFSSLYFLERGISPSQLAIINSVQSVNKLIGYPTFGIIADYFNNAKALLLISLVMSNGILLLFYFPSSNAVIFRHFTLLVLVRGLRSYCNCIWSLIDAVTMKVVADKKDYGKHRLYGSLAWGLNGVISGKLIDLYGMEMMFIVGIFWSAITFGLVYFCMPQNIKSPRSRSQQHKYEPITTDDSEIEMEQLELHDMEIQDMEMVQNDDKGETKTFDLCRIFKLLVSLRSDYQFLFSLGLMVIYWNAVFIVDRVLFIQMQ